MILEVFTKYTIYVIIYSDMKRTFTTVVFTLGLILTVGTLYHKLNTVPAKAADALVEESVRAARDAEIKRQVAEELATMPIDPEKGRLAIYREALWAGDSETVALYAERDNPRKRFKEVWGELSPVFDRFAKASNTQEALIENVKGEPVRVFAFKDQDPVRNPEGIAFMVLPDHEAIYLFRKGEQVSGRHVRFDTKTGQCCYQEPGSGEWVLDGQNPQKSWWESFAAALEQWPSLPLWNLRELPHKKLVKEPTNKASPPLAAGK